MPLPLSDALSAHHLLYLLVKGISDGSIYFPVLDPTPTLGVSQHEPKQRLLLRLAKTSVPTA